MNFTAEDIDTLNKIGDRWLVRTDNNGVSYNGFRWNPVGDWTEASDFNPHGKCGNGLHGQGPGGFGYTQAGTRLVFCETDGNHVSVGGDKIKVQKARILFVGASALLALIHKTTGEFSGSLYLSGSDLKGITLPQRVGGSHL